MDDQTILEPGMAVEVLEVEWDRLRAIEARARHFLGDPRFAGSWNLISAILGEFDA